MKWENMETAPKDGQVILVARNNDFFWEYDLVFWNEKERDYPWEVFNYSYSNGYPEGRLDYWTEIIPPYKIEV